MNSHTYVICLLLAICPLTGEAAAAAPPSDQPVIQAATSDSAVQVTAAAAGVRTKQLVVTDVMINPGVEDSLFAVPAS